MSTKRISSWATSTTFPDDLLGLKAIELLTNGEDSAHGGVLRLQSNAAFPIVGMHIISRAFTAWRHNHEPRFSSIDVYIDTLPGVRHTVEFAACMVGGQMEPSDYGRSFDAPLIQEKMPDFSATCGRDPKYRPDRIWIAWR